MIDNNTFEKWIDALESGEYKQAQGALRRKDGGFCCLGVLCDVIDPNGWNMDSVSRDDCIALHTLAGDVVQDQEGGYISSNLIPTSLQYLLASMNDSGRTFQQIAERIRERDFNRD